MKEEYQNLYNLISDENRDEAVLLAVKLLDEKKISVKELYNDILKHTLYDVKCSDGDKECVWKEHIRSSIVRTIMECAYPYIIKEKKKQVSKRVIVVCPSEEYHEIGAKMVHDFFSLSGYDSIFIGANTPLTEILSSVKHLKPDYLALSVTNFYNIILTKNIIEQAKEINPKLKIVVGGQAFKQNNALETVDYDYYLETFDDILSLEEQE